MNWEPRPPESWSDKPKVFHRFPPYHQAHLPSANEREKGKVAPTARALQQQHVIDEQEKQRRLQRNPQSLRVSIYRTSFNVIFLIITILNIMYRKLR